MEGSDVRARWEIDPPVTQSFVLTDPDFDYSYDYVSDINNAFDYLGDVYDFYSTEHGRLSYDGADAIVRAHVLRDYDGAAWIGAYMEIGRGNVTDDVFGPRVYPWRHPERIEFGLQWRIRSDQRIFF